MNAYHERIPGLRETNSAFSCPRVLFPYPKLSSIADLGMDSTQILAARTRGRYPRLNPTRPIAGPRRHWHISAPAAWLHQGRRLQPKSGKLAQISTPHPSFVRGDTREQVLL